MSTITSTTSATSVTSFYRRPLPDTCVALSSRRGRTMFESATRNKGLKSFFHLMDQHSTQSEPAYCGLSTLVVALNALAVDPRRPWKGPWRWYEEGMLNCCVDLEDVKQTGITIKTFQCLALCQGVSVSVSYAEEVTLQDFRDAIQTACVEQDTDDQVLDSNLGGEVLEDVLVVSYNRKILGQTGTGHFSPIAAYDATEDAVLILDTARFKYGSHWVPLPLMFEAMQTKDPDTGKSRGFILLSHDHSKADNDLPRLLLLRPEMKQSPYRLAYKQFLQQQLHERCDPNKSITWPEVFAYLTQDGKDSTYIWKMTHAQLLPTKAQSEIDQETMSTVNDVRRLIASLLPETSTLATMAICQSNNCRTLHLQPIEAIYIVYLASLDEETRRSVVMTASADVSDATRQQLLDEAELMRIAIDTSDTHQQGVS